MNDLATKQKINEIKTIIDEYYDASFKVHNDKCMPFIHQLVDRLIGLADIIEQKNQERLILIMQGILQAMEIKDYVLLRDHLYYQLKPFISSV